MPQALKRSGGMVFVWDNPLSDMIERGKAQTVSEIAHLGNTIAALEAAAAQAPSIKQIDTIKLMRESTIAIGGAPYLLDEREVEDAMKAQAQANAQQQAIAAAPNVAQIIDSGVNAAQAASEIPQQAEPGWALPSPV
jgi:hypothetical protein